jgi:hypothetical protein
MNCSLPFRVRATTVAVVLLALTAIQAPLVSGQDQEMRIPKGQSKDAWYGFNVKGKLSYVVRTRDKSNRMRVFWRTWGFGKERELGILSGEGEIEIPISLWSGVISARLRVEALDDTVLALRENAKVAHSVTFTWP